MASQFFPYELDRRFLPIWGVLGVREGKDGVTVTGDEMVATFGWVRLTTPFENLAGGHVTENYRWYTAVGVRLSFADDGLTFGTNTRRGVCIHFDEPVGGVIPRRTHSALTVTVAECEGLLDAIGRSTLR